MTHFEYLSVAVSIVLSISVAQLVVRLRDVLARDRRYWVHALWVAETLWLHVGVWWGYWQFHALETWNLGVFALVILGPALILFASSTLVTASEDLGPTWEDRFLQIRRWFFAARAGMVLQINVLLWLVSEFPVLYWTRGLGLLRLLGFAAAAYSPSRRVQAAVVVFDCSVVVLVIGIHNFWGPAAP
jgi:hypothetical protein